MKKSWKYLISICLTVVMTICLASCSGNTDEEVKETSSLPSFSQNESVEGFHVDGTKLLDANGNEFVMRGVNHAHTWFATSDVMAIVGIRNAGANCIRIVLSDGQQYNKDNLGTVKQVIELCKKNKMVVVLEVHDGTGSDDPKVLDAIADYWVELKPVLNGTEDYVIVNIANEWFGSWGNTGVYADAYESAIAKIREAGIHNLLMVDSAGWGQYAKSLDEHAAEIFAADPEANTMFSIHMYGSAGGNATDIANNIEYVTDQNLCVCIGEFGYNHSDGDVDEAYIMEYCEENDIGYMAWSWKGNGSPVEYLDLSADWGGEELSPEWGDVVVNGPNGLMETSELCSIFAE